jgi:hypothetical protein
MKMLNRFFLIFIACFQSLFFVQVLTGANNMYPNADISSNKTDAFVKKAYKKLEKKYNIFICGIGGGVRDKTWLVNLSFTRRGPPLTEIEARKLVVAITEDFLAMINKEEKLIPYMENYPFTTNNVSIAVFSEKKNGEDYCHPYISIASASRGNFMLISYDSENPMKKITDIYETYEETLAILAKEKQNQ